MRRKSTIQALADSSSALLKFDNEKAYLPPEGLKMISDLPGYIYPVILMGDGRAGKSYLASRFLNLEEIFVSSDSAEPVTEGIDAVVVPMSKLLADCPDLGDKTFKGSESDSDDDEEQMHMLVLDCEGGNNAMAAIRTLVNVFGIVIGTEVVFVCGGSFSEAALQNLGASLAARSLIKVSGDDKLPEQRLVFVVNKNTLKYGEDTLEKALTTPQTDPGRQEVRSAVTTSFAKRKFFAVPLMQLPGFEEQVQALRKQVLQDRRPLQMGGVKMKGPALASLLKCIVAEMQSMNEVSFPSMTRCVIMDGFLTPLVKRLIDESKDEMPELEDYDGKLAEKDPRENLLQQFDKESVRISDKDLLTEAKNDLKEKLDEAWAVVVKLNNTFGEQVLETRTETKEEHTGQERRQIGGGGMMKGVQLTYQRMKVSMRSVIVKKNGKETYGEWVESKAETTKLLEDAFQGFTNSVPIVQGKLLKRSPNKLKLVFTGFKGEYQERCCVVREGHLIWWDPARVQMPAATDSESTRRQKEIQQVQGMISFLLNRAQVEKVDQETLRIFPATSSGWSDSSSFTGGGSRELMFQVGSLETLGRDYSPVDIWVDAIKKNIEFGDRAFQQLGTERIIDEVGKDPPQLRQAIWRKPKS
mmetsp:Transcript_47579/g.101807  ORF Transcript_47579/g.101807 Transcript_47579/m.101807 type:complete len:640 (+) Transcript_47579:134-2053(+)|eukprot:CAMPEP_0206463572 /NCGR_PEP_ID=MMETSP0324_2-20121206/26686_1 /ASSEMBLY_ACC=CAM_ASM_000836 /TAXON_ID=2866 /ORGANISM="Crypthecodinium cohnii, Strain Seligo" /LENGTH=639 /DNA_ID=CAMNT_0053936009 /DNA_START=55 /DNA_END=1974 /DNA_ORIENTATION=+